MSLKMEIKTDVSKEGVILQSLFQNASTEMRRWVCDTREEDIKKALIALGWTPPPKEKKPYSQAVKEKDNGRL